MDVDYALLRKAELFNALMDEDLDFLHLHTRTIDLAPGGVIFQPGERPAGFYFLLAGEVSLTKAVGQDMQLQLARYHAGDVFGEFNFVTGLAQNSTARVEAQAKLLVFPADQLTLEDLAAENPASLSRVLLKSTAMVASRLRSTNRLITENSAWVGELRKQIYLDSGTGLWNRSFLDEEIVRFLEKPTALITLKPDRFKELNDERGHQAGDEAMNRIRDVLQEEVNQLGRGWACRLRSNETAVVVPSFGPEETAALAEHLAARLAAITFAAENGHPAFTFTASAAWSLWPQHGSDWPQLVRRTHERVLAAWKDGGNQLCPL